MKGTFEYLVEVLIGGDGHAISAIKPLLLGKRFTPDQICDVLVCFLHTGVAFAVLIDLINVSHGSFN